MHGKCPKCEKLVMNVNIDGIEASVPFGSTWKSVAYTCPMCNTVLGVQMDPIAIKTDIVKEVLDALGVSPIKRR